MPHVVRGGPQEIASAIVPIVVDPVGVRDDEPFPVRDGIELESPLSFLCVTGPAVKGQDQWYRRGSVVAVRYIHAVGACEPVVLDGKLQNRDT